MKWIIVLALAATTLHAETSKDIEARSDAVIRLKTAAQVVIAERADFDFWTAVVNDRNGIMSKLLDVMADQQLAADRRDKARESAYKLIKGCGREAEELKSARDRLAFQYRHFRSVKSTVQPIPDDLTELVQAAEVAAGKAEEAAPVVAAPDAKKLEAEARKKAAEEARKKLLEDAAKSEGK